MFLYRNIFEKAINNQAFTFIFIGSSENSSQTIQVAEPYVRKVQLIQERFVKALQIHLSHFEDGPKLTEIFTWFENLGLNVL